MKAKVSFICNRCNQPYSVTLKNADYDMVTTYAETALCKDCTEEITEIERLLDLFLSGDIALAIEPS